MHPLLKQLGDIGLGVIVSEIHGDEDLDSLFKNLIVIINHFFEYGFIKPKKSEAG